MIPDEQLIGSILKLLEPSEQVDVEQALFQDQELLKRYRVLEKALSPFEVAKGSIELPQGLVAATIAKTASYVLEHGLPPAVPTYVTVPATISRTWLSDPHWQAEAAPTSTWRPMELLVAGFVLMIAVGFGFAGVQKIRHDRQVTACQNQMRQLHTALTTYSSTEGGRLPQVGTAAVPTAGSFSQELQRKGHLASDQAAYCPDSSPFLPFAYTLGYRTSFGSLRGISANSADWTPILADLPQTALQQVSHSTGQNVLFWNGSVRFSTITKVGAEGDDIYLNDAELPRAGLHPFDTSLGMHNAIP
jgi:hypothetical protein